MFPVVRLWLFDCAVLLTDGPNSAGYFVLDVKWIGGRHVGFIAWS